MRIEFEDLIQANNQMASALNSLSYWAEIIENSPTPDLIGVSDILACLAAASKHHKERLTLILQMTEQRGQENAE